MPWNYTFNGENGKFYVMYFTMIKIKSYRYPKIMASGGISQSLRVVNGYSDILLCRG